ncbi:unnamed protein product [Mycena citricolor]|uniref:Uncharacterized protein n=1 Tax=Mycena citricolor TaxID=2018698 RepID=A0AAD2H8M5_9AGAR|nr:unnamed protein product [Mycena citricolor]CAK5271401.1 unnamed protein product [Mycena citricolor]CAK5271853.1 unnamed protein product [Mycena citricolor]
MSATPATISALPPCYPSAPSYSVEPAPDEKRLEFSRRYHSRAQPTGNFVKRTEDAAVVLLEQDDDAEIPVYGRGASIRGFVTIDQDRELVSEVVVKIKGRIEAMVSEAGAHRQTILDDSHTLWSSSSSRNSSVCPGAVPFVVTLPTHFKHYSPTGARDLSLPASYELPNSTVPGLFLRISYIMQIVVTRVRSQRWNFIAKKSKLVCVPFKYSPRSQPAAPIHPVSDFFLDIKTMPEEFRQIVWQLTPRPKSSVDPLDLQLFLPASGVFALDDTLPFHVHLSGPRASLRRFAPASVSAAAGDESLAVMLVRQIVYDHHGQRAARTMPIGHAQLSCCPPQPGVAPDGDGSPASLDWTGEVRCSEQTQVASFMAGSICAQDFFVVQFRPAGCKTSQLYTTLRFSLPVRIVTESWMENSWLR